MSKRASTKTDVSIVRSSAAEYLTFVAASGKGGVEVVYHRADAEQPNMGLTTWKDTPPGSIPHSLPGWTGCANSGRTSAGA